MFLLAQNGYSLFLILGFGLFVALALWLYYRKKSKDQEKPYRQAKEMYRAASKRGDIGNMIVHGTAARRNEHITLQFIQEMHLDVKKSISKYPRLIELKNEINDQMLQWYGDGDWPDLDEKKNWGKFDENEPE